MAADGYAGSPPVDYRPGIAVLVRMARRGTCTPAERAHAAAVALGLAQRAHAAAIDALGCASLADAAAERLARIRAGGVLAAARRRRAAADAELGAELAAMARAGAERVAAEFGGGGYPAPYAAAVWYPGSRIRWSCSDGRTGSDPTASASPELAAQFWRAFAEQRLGAVAGELRTAEPDGPANGS
jgi:hypothetical protein